MASSVLSTPKLINAPTKTKVLTGGTIAELLIHPQKNYIHIHFLIQEYW
jgi:hypothetical protein